jgi:hypothetical protein
MFILKPLLLATLTSASALLRRADTQTNLQTIDTDTRSLIKTEQSYNGGLFAALAIKNAADKVDDDIKCATSDAQSSPPLTEDQAQAAIDYVNSTLEPDVAKAIDVIISKKAIDVIISKKAIDVIISKKAIDVIISKKANAQRDGVAGTVRDELTKLRMDTQTYGEALKGIAPADKQAGADAPLDKVVADFQRGADAYAS